MNIDMPSEHKRGPQQATKEAFQGKRGTSYVTLPLILDTFKGTQDINLGEGAAIPRLSIYLRVTKDMNGFECIEILTLICNFNLTFFANSFPHSLQTNAC